MKTTIISPVIFLGVIYLNQWSCAPFIGGVADGIEIVGAAARAGHTGAQGVDLTRTTTTGDHSFSAINGVSQIGKGGSKTKLPAISKSTFEEQPKLFTPSQSTPKHTLPDNPHSPQLTPKLAESKKPTPFPEDPNTSGITPATVIHDGVVDDRFLAGTPKPFSPIGKNSKEYWQLFTTRAMLRFISERGTPEMKTWIEHNEFAQAGLAWFKQESWLGHVLTKHLKVDPKWRIEYDSTAFGKEGLTGKISKGWLKAWGKNDKSRKAVESAIRFPFTPLLKAIEGISKAIDKLSAKTIDYYLEWLRVYGSPEIRSAIPNFKKGADATVIPHQ